MQPQSTLGRIVSDPTQTGSAATPHALLCAKLARLVEQAKASFATVVDETGHLLAWSRVLEPEELGRVGRHMDDALASTQGKPLRSGGTVRLLGHAPGRWFVAHSFGGIHVLLLCFEEKYGVGPAMAHVRRELPEIEQMTIALPADEPARGGRGRAPRAPRKRR